MKSWSVKTGTFWVSNSASAAPAEVQARVKTSFHELGRPDLDDLQAAMSSAGPDEIASRFIAGKRCFGLKQDGRIAAYGWATRGVETVGELERDLNFHDHETYIWDCGTIPELRGLRLYTALLSRMLHRLRAEGVERIWIGSDLDNRPSIQGIRLAGFDHVLDLGYLRLLHFTFLRFSEAPGADRDSVEAAYRILVKRSEKRYRRLAFGFQKKGKT